MAIRTTDEANLTAIANAIRSKTGESGPLEYPDDFVSGISGIETVDDLDWAEGEDY